MAINNVTGAQSIIKAGICTSTTRPAAPFVGQLIFETDTSRLKVWLGSGWSAGTLHSRNLTVEYLVIAGGGGGSGATSTNVAGGGGGAGGYRSSVSGESSGANSTAETPISLTTGTYTVTVGAGGAGTYTNNTVANSGTTSVFYTITSIGGGGGGSGSVAGVTGGSAGGGGSSATALNIWEQPTKVWLEVMVDIQVTLAHLVAQVVVLVLLEQTIKVVVLVELAEMVYHHQLLEPQ